MRGALSGVLLPKRIRGEASGARPNLNMARYEPDRGNEPNKRSSIWSALAKTNQGSGHAVFERSLHSAKTITPF